MRFAPYSFSKMDTYVQCPKKFQFSYIDKLPKKPQDLTPLLKGGAVHNILELHPEPATHKLAPQYQHIVDEFLATELGQKSLKTESVREYKLGIDKELKPCKYSDKKALFRGIVDYIHTDENVLHLKDWKTGKAKELKWQNFSQLIFYAIYFFQKYPTIDKIYISYIYVEHNTHNSLLLERQYLDNYKVKMLSIIKDIETDQVFEKKPQRLCDWCDYQEHCQGI